MLIHISQQLSNSTTPAFEPAALEVSSNAAVAHILVLLSLVLVLIDAFLAILVKGWLQEYDRGWRKHTVPELRAQERERRLQELERWKLDEFVAFLPILIQGSLFLFCLSLLAFIFPVHLPFAIVCSVFFVSVVGFYCLTTYVSVVNHYAPFSSPVSRLLARGLAMLQTAHIILTQIPQRIAPAIPFHNRLPVSQGQHTGTDASDGTMQPFSSDAPLAQPHGPNSVEKSNMVPRSRSIIDAQTHAHVLERLVMTTAEAVENIPIFLELLDQPVRDPTMQPFNMEKWKELLHITFRLLRDQSTFSVSAACTLVRTMMICYDHKTADQQLCLELQHHLGSRDIDNQGPRMPLHAFFSFYLRSWLDDPRSGIRLFEGSPLYHLCQTIAFLEPSDAADAELFWMVNTSHRTLSTLNAHLDMYLQFCIAVLTYVASTEQGRRSKVPLTAAVIYALRTVGPALDNRGINPIDGPDILQGTVSIGPVSTTFCRNDGVTALNLWSEECIQRVKDLLQWDPSSSMLNEFHLSLIAALHIDSTKQAHARSTFADLLERTSIAGVQFRFSDAYNHDKLVVYMCVAAGWKPLEENGSLPTLYEIIWNTITEHSELKLSVLHILEFALKRVHDTRSLSLDWLDRSPSGSISMRVGDRHITQLVNSDHWVLLHLDTLLTPKAFLLSEEVGKLEWSDTPAKVHIAKARLSMYDAFSDAGHEAGEGSKPDPGLLRLFLWSKDHGVCTRAFKWSLDLVPISQSGIPGDANSTNTFIPEAMGYEWVEHFIHVLCKGAYEDRGLSWRLLVSDLVPKWTMLPSSWRRDFASALFSPIVQPLDVDGLLAYQCLAEANEHMSLDAREAFLPFIATLLGLAESSLTPDSLTSLENWLADLPEGLENQDAQTKMRDILATREPQLTPEFLATELPTAVTATSS